MKCSLQLMYTCALSVSCAFSQGIGGRNAPLNSRWDSFAVPESKIMLTGSVQLSDGMPLPGAAAIQLVCGGSARTVAHTGVLDSFGFQIGTSRVSGLSGIANGFSSDAASAFHPMAGPINCDLRAELSGFRSSVIHLSRTTTFDGADVGVIWLHRLAAPRGSTVSVTTLAAPKAAKKNFEKGRKLARAGKLEKAASYFQQAVKIHPRFAEAWLDLGFTQYRMESTDAARTSALKAREIDPKLAGIYRILGYIASDEKDWKAAARYLEEAEQLDPLGPALPWYISAVAYYQLHRFDDAERCIRREMQLDQQHQYRRAPFLLGLILVARNDVSSGSRILRDYLASSPDPADVTAANALLRRIELRAAK
jgi:tetratricopeptide (TPR) repeat protein